jgi:hypothetical protein
MNQAARCLTVHLEADGGRARIRRGLAHGGRASAQYGPERWCVHLLQMLVRRRVGIGAWRLAPAWPTSKWRPRLRCHLVATCTAAMGGCGFGLQTKITAFSIANTLNPHQLALPTYGLLPHSGKLLDKSGTRYSGDSETSSEPSGTHSSPPLLTSPVRGHHTPPSRREKHPPPYLFF